MDTNQTAARPLPSEEVSPDPVCIEKASLRYARWILGLLGVAAVIAIVVFISSLFKAARIPATYLLLAGLYWEILLVRGFSRLGRAPASMVPLLAGWAFILGSIGLDVTMTLIKTPDLEQEANLVVRAFLASGYSVSFIRGIGVVGQGGLALLTCLAWTAFVRHRGTVVALAWALGPRSFKEFSNAAIRGVLRPPMLVSRAGFALPRFNWYRMTCMMLCGFAGCSLYRLYCGLDWLGLVPPLQPLITVPTASAGVVYFYVWLWLEYRKGQGTKP